MRASEPVQELYLHIPFCVRKCAYCDFASVGTKRDDPALDAYVGALVFQLKELADAGLLAGLSTGYVGGGTPSMLGAGRLRRLLEEVTGATTPKELTVEANPDTLDDDVLEALVEAGATRVSLGVQSLDERELAALGRLHSAEGAVVALRLVCESSLSVSCDLMCAIPYQTEASWQRTLDTVVSLGLTHVSVYPLMLEEGTPLYERYGGTDDPTLSEDVAASRMEMAEATLSEAGLVRYEVASYARLGCACAHNIGYWTGATYLGLGPSAASMVDRASFEALRQVMPQLPELEDDVSRIRMRITSTTREVIHDPWLASARLDLEFLNARQAWAEDLMLGMRLTSGVDESRFKGAETTLDELVERGLVRREKERVVPTHDGWLLGNELYGALWDLAGGPVRETCC